MRRTRCCGPPRERRGTLRRAVREVPEGQRLRTLRIRAGPKVELRRVVRATPRSQLYPLLDALRRTLPPADRRAVLPMKLRKRNAVRPVPLQAPTKREVLARRLARRFAEEGVLVRA